MKYAIFNDWLYNDQTKQIENDEGTPVGSLTYEYPWSTNLGLGFRWYRLNPLNYPTKDTAEKVLAWVKRNVIVPGYSFSIAELDVAAPGIVTLNRDEIPMKRFPQYLIALNRVNGEQIEVFSAGLIGFGVMKNGEVWQKASFRDEVALAIRGKNW